MLEVIRGQNKRWQDTDRVNAKCCYITIFDQYLTVLQLWNCLPSPSKSLEEKKCLESRIVHELSRVKPSHTLYCSSLFDEIPELSQLKLSLKWIKQLKRLFKPYLKALEERRSHEVLSGIAWFILLPTSRDINKSNVHEWTSLRL